MAQDVWMDSFGVDRSRVGPHLVGLAEVYMKKGDLAEAESIYRRAVTIWDPVANPDPEAMAEALEGHAMVLRLLDRDAEASGQWARATAIRAKFAVSGSSAKRPSIED